MSIQGEVKGQFVMHIAQVEPENFYRRRRRGMKKKLISLMLVGAMATSLVACGGAESTGSSDGDSTGEGDTAAVQSEDENTLTVYGREPARVHNKTEFTFKLLCAGR